jgi:hypothetical protein
MYQQHQDPQRHHSYTGWLTNNDMALAPMPAHNAAGTQQQGDAGHGMAVNSTGDIPGAMSFDLQMFLDQEGAQTDIQGGAGFAQQQQGDRRLRSMDSQVSGTSHAHEQHPDHPQMLPNSQGGSNENSGHGDVEEGLSKEGLQALRDARNREKNKRYAP